MYKEILQLLSASSVNKWPVNEPFTDKKGSSLIKRCFLYYFWTKVQIFIRDISIPSAKANGNNLLKRLQNFYRWL